MDFVMKWLRRAGYAAALACYGALAYGAWLILSWIWTEVPGGPFIIGLPLGVMLVPICIMLSWGRP